MNDHDLHEMMVRKVVGKFCDKQASATNTHKSFFWEKHNQKSVTQDDVREGCRIGSIAVC